MTQTKVLVDSIYINNSGGKVLLDYFINSIIEKEISNKFYFVLDPRGQYKYLDDIEYHIGKSSEKYRKNFYKNNYKNYNKVFCFGNVPPPIKLNIKVYTYFHNALLATSIKGYPLKIKLLKYFKRLYIKIKSKNTNVFLVQSALMKKLVEDNISSKTEVLLYPFFYLKEVSDRLGNVKSGYVYISNGNPHKNHNLLLDAWNELYQQGYKPKLNLTITKDYPLVIERISSLQKKGVNLENHGYTDVEKIFNQSLYLIYPSLIESFGLGLVEAVNSGLKVIASNLPYVTEVINPSLVFDPSDKQSIIIAVKESIDNNSLKDSNIIIENKINELIELLIDD